jgi:hypothetical protein
MFHPLIRLLAGKPHLVATHLAAYAELASAQGQDIAQALMARVAWSVGAVVCALAACIVGGVSLLLLAALPVSAMPAPWLLLVVPGAALLGGLLCGLQARRRLVAWTLDPIRDQLQADASMLAALETP